MRHLFCESIPGADEVAWLDAGEARHLFGVLRARSGAQVGLLDGRGTLAVAEVRPDQGLRIVERRQVPAPVRRIHLLVAPPRHQQMDQLLRQCAEVGVWRILPVATAREVAKPDRNQIPTRWRQHLLEGCKQAHNPFLPEIVACQPLATALSSLPEAATRWYGAPGASGVATATPDPTQSPGAVAWLVGPEGGFTPAEETAIGAAGFRPLSLGPWILRVETAAIVGAAILGQGAPGKA